MQSVTRQQAKPEQRKKLLAPRIKEEVAANHKGRKRKARGDDLDEEYEIKLLDH